MIKPKGLDGKEKLNNVWVTSDLHWSHTNIAGPKVSSWKRGYRDFDSVWDMNECLLNNLNELVKEEDTLYFLGDWSFGGHQNVEKYRNLLRVKDIRFMLGNHDKYIYKYFNLFTWIKPIWEGKINDRYFVLNHFAQKTWNHMHQKSIHLYGHCVDEKTEILTKDGWKNYLTLKNNDIIYSYNSSSKFLEERDIKKIFIYKNYKDNVYEINNNKMSFCYTENHNIVGYFGKKWKTKKPIDLINSCTPIKLVRSGNLSYDNKINLSDDELRLYICLVADGNIVNTDLGRLRASKERKIKYFKSILDRMNIKYSENLQKDLSICLNFTIPKNIMNFKIKGLDKRLLKISSQEQCDIILEAYSNTDGSIYDKSIIIYSSKKEEIEILQHLFSINGFLSTFSSRKDHGFSKNESYQLCVTKKKEVKFSTGKNINVYKNKNKIFWCIETELGNFMCRRNGKVYITGNSHGSLEDSPYELSIDVGIDTCLYGHKKYTPYHYDEICYIMDNYKTFLSKDHHE